MNQQVCITSKLENFTFGKHYVMINKEDVNSDIPEYMILVRNDQGEIEVVYHWDFVSAEEYVLSPSSYYEVKDQKRTEQNNAAQTSKQKWWKFW